MAIALEPNFEAPGSGRLPEVERRVAGAPMCIGVRDWPPAMINKIRHFLSHCNIYKDNCGAMQ